MERVKIGKVKPVKGVDYFTDEDIADFDARYAKHCVQANTPAGGSATFIFDSAVHTAVISCRAAEQDIYALFVYSGYGSGGVCSNVDRICGQSPNIACEIRQESEDETNGFTLRNNGSADLICTVFSLMGTNPIVEFSDGGAAEVS